MEDVLELYVAKHSEDEPLVCMDEASKQLLNTDFREAKVTLNFDKATRN
jgi:hypothetical protein